ncbi:MAG: aldo/keto reductase [Gammaproteobacteria bacterium]|nr:aldo/keto reductase [Gammaproteobacteria bacterium]
MKTFKLSSGDSIPALGFGTWQTPERIAYERVTQALQCGYHHIDCAAIYLNEKAVGQALSEHFNSYDTRREQLWITSKLWNSYHAPEEVTPALRRGFSLS